MDPCRRGDPSLNRQLLGLLLEVLKTSPPLSLAAEQKATCDAISRFVATAQASAAPEDSGEICVTGSACCDVLLRVPVQRRCWTRLLAWQCTAAASRRSSARCTSCSPQIRLRPSTSLPILLLSAITAERLVDVCYQGVSV